MNISAVRWVVLLALVAAAAAADLEDDYEEEGVPAAPAKPARPSPLLRTARGPAIGRPAPKTAVTQKTTTTTEAAPPPEYDEEEFGDEVAEESPTTTTEAPKKGGLRTGVVRPFRSNTDLIEALKKRRQQQRLGGQHSDSSTTTTTGAPPPPPDKGFKAGGRRTATKPLPDQTSSTSERRSTVNGRRFNARGNTKTTEAPVEEEPEEPVKPSTSRFGKARRV